jgi:hypothetical protein
MAMRRTALAAMVAALLLAACDSKPDFGGSYSDKNGLMSLNFHSNGKVTVDTIGGGGDFDYVVSGKTITLKMPQGDQTLTIADDGTLTVPGGPPLIKDREYACKDDSGAIGNLRLSGDEAYVVDPKDQTAAGTQKIGTFTDDGKQLVITDAEGSNTYTEDKGTLTAGKVTCTLIGG